VAPDRGDDEEAEEEEEVLAREPGEPVEDADELGPSGNGQRP
jgi:hypothetical protein